MTKDVKCRWCDKPALKFKNPDLRSYQLVVDVEGAVPYRPFQVFQLFEIIPDTDLELMGFKFEGGRKGGRALSHPKDMIMRSLLVMAPIHRPNGFVNNKETKHTFTTLYECVLDIIMGIKNEDPDVKRTKIQCNIANMFDNKNDTKTRGQNGDKQVTLKSFFQGRDGFFRRGMAGKRVNFSARTVIGPGPGLNFKEVGVPEYIAKILTTPILVTHQNIAYLSTLFENEKVNFHTPSEGPRKGARLPVNPIYIFNNSLEIGDLVERQMLDGDPVIYNRQPTLHKYSMMVGRAKIIPGNIIRINLPVTTPYNADFDGDEMNLHFPQGEKELAEMEQLMSVDNNLISNQTNKPVFGEVLDTVKGMYLLTNESLTPEINPEIFEYSIRNLLVSDIDEVEFRDRLASFNIPVTKGRAVFSLTLPKGFNYSKKNIEIKNGILVSGVIESKHIGQTHGSLMQEIANRYSTDEASEFLTNNYKIADYFLSVHGGSTVSLADCPDDSCMPVNVVNNLVLLKTLLLDAKMNRKFEINDPKLIGKDFLKIINTIRDDPWSVKSVKMIVDYLATLKSQVDSPEIIDELKSRFELYYFTEYNDLDKLLNIVNILQTLSTNKQIDSAVTKDILSKLKTPGKRDPTQNEMNTVRDLLNPLKTKPVYKSIFSKIITGSPDFDTLDPENLFYEKYLLTVINYLGDHLLTLYQVKMRDYNIAAEQIMVLEKPMDEIAQRQHDKSVTDILTKVDNQVGDFLDRSLLPTNSFSVMMNSGSKGKITNVKSMNMSLGLQFLKGQLLRRTMMFNKLFAEAHPFDSCPINIGYCLSSYYRGLTPKEFFSHGSASREGMIDTATGIQDTGYLHRRMMKSLEDVRVGMRGETITASDTIIQFVYGDDGFDTTSFRQTQLGDLKLNSVIDIKDIFDEMNLED